MEQNEIILRKMRIFVGIIILNYDKRNNELKGWQGRANENQLEVCRDTGENGEDEPQQTRHQAPEPPEEWCSPYVSRQSLTPLKTRRQGGKLSPLLLMGDYLQNPRPMTP